MVLKKNPYESPKIRLFEKVCTSGNTGVYSSLLMVLDAPFYSQIVRITHTNHTSRIVYSQLESLDSKFKNEGTIIH